MPASFMVDAARPGAIGLFPSTVAMRDGTRTRDSQGHILMLYLLSYSDRCSCRTRLRNTENQSQIREDTAPPELTSASRNDSDTLQTREFAANQTSPHAIV